MIEFQVDGMTCGGCVRAVTRAVKSVAPAADVSVDLASKRISVSGSDDVESIAQALNDAGYEAAASGPG